MQLWKKRIIRLWIVILLPIGIIFSYQTFLQNNDILKIESIGNDEIYQLEFDDSSILRNKIQSFIKNDDDQLAKVKYYELFNKSINERNVFAITSIVLVCFPLISLLLTKIYIFVIYGPEQHNGNFKKWSKYALCFALILFAILALYLFVVKKNEEAPAPVPSNFESEGVKKLLNQFDQEDNAKKKKTRPL